MGPRTRIAVGLATAIVLLASMRHDQTAAQAPVSAAGQPVPVAQPSGILPVVVNIPGSVQSPEDARPFFDDFSWRSMIALSWPADPARRGVPKSPGTPGVFLKAGSSYPAVWGSYREAYELFRVDGSRPNSIQREGAIAAVLCRRARRNQGAFDGNEIGHAAAGDVAVVLLPAGRSESELCLLRDPLQSRPVRLRAWRRQDWHHGSTSRRTLRPRRARRRSACRSARRSPISRAPSC